MATTNTPRERRTADYHERLSAVEVDVRHLDERIGGLSREMQEGFSSLQRSISSQKQPLTAFAGWAAVVLSLVYAFVSPMNKTDSRIEDRLDKIEDRELNVAFERGVATQRFETLAADIDAAVANRKDIDEKHVQAQERLSQRIDEVQHSLDNGLGRRIQEMTNPMIERLLAIERVVFNPRFDRDMDRK